MYKCGWQGCEKAYGTLNHLNAHVTMQSHGAKRTPEGKPINRFYLPCFSFFHPCNCYLSSFVANGCIGLAPVIGASELH